MSSKTLWRPLDPANITHPYTMYEALRTQEPVHLSQTGEYIVSRYEDVRSVLRNRDFLSGNRLTWLKRGISYLENKEEDVRAIRDAMNAFILMLNGDQHQRIRTFIAKTWTDRDVGEIITANVRHLLESLRGKRELDFVSEFAQPLPVYTIARILGVPVGDARHLVSLGIAMTKALDLYITLKDFVRIDAAARDFLAFFRQQVKEKYDRPDDALLSRLIRKNREDQAGLSEEELVSAAIFLFTAGEETTASLLANTLRTLLEHPGDLETVRRDPAQLPAAIEEVLRFDPVVHLLGRTAEKESQLGNTTIPAGATLTLVLASANRDERVFPDADQFQIGRTPNRHLSFGNGAHYCLGDWLARRQSQIAIGAFLERYPRITLADEELRWFNNIAVRRLDSLPLNVST